MTNTKKGAALASEKKVANANVVSKSEHDALVEATAKVIANDLKKQTKSAPTAEELAAKAAKKAISRRDKATDEALKLTKGEILDASNWLKVFKKHFPKKFAAYLDKHFATLCVEVKKAGGYYAESVVITDKKSGEKRTVKQYHMVKFELAEQVTEIGRAITPTEYRFTFGEEAISISSVKELTVSHEYVEYEVLKQEINGEEWTRRVEHKSQRDFRPVEYLDLSYGEFAKRIKLAMQVVFPNGFDEE